MTSTNDTAKGTWSKCSVCRAVAKVDENSHCATCLAEHRANFAAAAKEDTTHGEHDAPHAWGDETKTNDTNARPVIVKEIPATRASQNDVVEIDRPCHNCVATPANNSQMTKEDYEAWTDEDPRDDCIWECDDCQNAYAAAEADWDNEAECRFEQMRSDEAERLHGCN